MKSPACVCVTLGLMLKIGASAQTNPPRPGPPPDPQPIYRVTVVSRTLQAVNYEHRGGPTKIDFQGTVLLPKSKGEAIVESKRGRVSIDAKLEHVEPPTKFGREYLTYVLWAITPEGRPKNLGEMLVDDSNKAHITVTTEMQAFGLLITAEPYYSVTIPSDVVVLENVVRPDTIGTREEITAKYELLPRGGYTMTVQPNQLRSTAEAEKLPYDRYETILEVYQAQNAVQIARSLGADHYAPESFSKAENLLAQAQNFESRHADTHTIISAAREATQMAEDARVITVKRRDEERQLREKQQQSQDQSRAIENAQAAAQHAQAQAAAAEAAAEAERANAARARRDAEQAQIIATQRAAQAEAERERLASRASGQPPVTGQVPVIGQQQSRSELIVQLNSILTTRDTPRGLVVTVPDVSFDPGRNTLGLVGSAQLARIGAMVARHPGLTVKIEGYTDDRGTDRADQSFSEQRAQAVRQVLVANGVPPQAAIAIAYGKSRPISSNATAGGREQNRRVEIVISGPSIGARALWDRTYSLK
jgi:outer membrane protein OmpA-like peptidoglycan-associated protein